MAEPSVTPDLERIFIQIPNYRDPECQWTVKDLFDKAKHPSRIFVGICWQLDPEKDQHCVLFPFPKGQVREKWYHYRESQGLGWARAEAQSLWQGEEYSLQIDSHMRFAPGWDELFLDTLKRCPSKRAVISELPAAYTPPHHLDKNAYCNVLTAKSFKSDGGLFHGTVPVPAELGRPVLAAFIAGGYIFGPAQIIKDAASDPHLYFSQEEILTAARLWTHGWDLCAPDRTILYHYYNVTEESKKRPLHWSDNADWGKINSVSHERFDHLMDVKQATGSAVLKDIDRFGMGTARTIQDYWAFCDVDFRTKAIGLRGKHGLFDPDMYRLYLKSRNYIL